MNADAGPTPDPAAEAPLTAGALLKAAREKQGLHIAALAAAIKVSPRKLEALEANRLAELPDATFTRALAQTVCRTLKIDARPVLDRLPAAGPQPLVPPDAGLNEPFREGAARGLRVHDESPIASLALRPMVLGAVLLLIASVALYWLPPLDRWGAGTALPAPAASAVAPAAPASALALMPPPAASVPAAAASSPMPAASGAASAPMAETVFSAPPPGAEPGPAAAAAMLQLRVNESSWIEVRDARGTTLLSRTVSPGEQVGLNGEPPLALVIGNAAATELVFRGRPVDLAGRSRDNVARLQLP